MQRVQFDTNVHRHVYKRRSDIHSMLLRAVDDSLHGRFVDKVYYPDSFDLNAAKRCLEDFEECSSRITDRFIASLGNSEERALLVLGNILETPIQVVEDGDDDHVRSEIIPLKQTLPPAVLQVARPLPTIPPAVPVLKSSRPLPTVVQTTKSARPTRQATPSQWYRETYPTGSPNKISGDMGVSADRWFDAKMSLQDFQNLMSRAATHPRFNTTPDAADDFFRSLRRVGR